MSNPLSTNANLNSNGNLEKPINSNNNLEYVHLTIEAMPLPKSEEFATLWRTSELHVKKKIHQQPLVHSDY